MIPTVKLAFGRLRRLAPRYGGPVILSLLFGALLTWTWRKWPHVLVDFGRELYVPWQLSEGAVLYRDIAYFNGPLSPYFNALLFQTFDVSLTTLIVANALLLVVLVALVYRWLADACGQLAATVACVVLLCVFSFAQLDMAGNYNYICPYSHEMTHGLFLSFAVLWLLRGRMVNAASDALKLKKQRATHFARVCAAGVCWGLVFLGKAELFVAASGAAAVALALPLMMKQTSPRRWIAEIGVFAAAGALPVACFATALSTLMPVHEALLGVTGSWRWILASDVSSQHFYRRTLGLDDPLLNFLLMLKAAACVSLVIAAAVLVDRWRSGERRKYLALLAGVACITAAILVREKAFPYLIEGRFLLITAVVSCGAMVIAAWRCRHNSEQLWRFAMLLPWSVLALLLMAKLLLIPRVHHYGFVLAMPAAVLAAALAVHYLPELLCKRWSGGPTFRAAIVILLIVDAGTFVFVSSDHYARKTLPVAGGGDCIMVEGPDVNLIGSSVNQVLQEIETRFPADATIAVLPEGVTLNYLARRRNPIPYINVMPPEVVMFGEEAIVAALDRHRPDCILLVHKDTSEYGVSLFGGEDYGHLIVEWVDRHYRLVQTIGEEPFRSRDSFGIKMMVRRDAAETHDRIVKFGPAR